MVLYFWSASVERCLPVTVTVGEYELVDAPFGQPVGQPSLVRGVRDLHPAEILERRVWYNYLFHRLAQRQHRVVFAAKMPFIFLLFFFISFKKQITIRRYGRETR